MRVNGGVLGATGALVILACAGTAVLVTDEPSGELASLEGRVVDLVTREPAADAWVVLSTSTSGEVRRERVSDAGVALLEGLAPGEYSMAIEVGGKQRLLKRDLVLKRGRRQRFAAQIETQDSYPGVIRVHDTRKFRNPLDGGYVVVPDVEVGSSLQESRP